MDSHEGRMLTRVRRWGNSLGLRIPRSFAAETGVRDGSTVDLTVENGDLRVRPVPRRRYALAELLKGVGRRNVHGEVPSGGPSGREAW
jgi:antitoxin MazE